MTTGNLTFDNAAATRPTLADLGGAAKVNATKPADPVTMPTAEEWNHFAKLLEGLGRVTPSVTIWVTFSAGTPSISDIRAIGSTVVIGDFTVTDNGAGDTTISWAAGKLPNVCGAGPANVTETADTEIDRIRAYYPTGTSVRIKTKLITVATDCNFAVTIV